MDEQDPRLAAERRTRRGKDDAIGLDRTSADRSSAVTGSTTDSSYGSTSSADIDIDADADADTTRRTREIRADIEQTRGELSETVTAIQDRLRPSNVAANAADNLKAAASERARDMAESRPAQYVRDNPIPSAMIGIGIAGLAWLAFGERAAPNPDRTYNYGRVRNTRSLQGRYGGASYGGGTGYSGYGATSEEGTELYGEASGWSNEGGAEQGGQGFSGGTGQGMGMGSGQGMGQRMSGAAPRMRGHLARTWNQSPLLVGAAAMVAGAIVGLSVPETERENELMGEARDSMVGNVQQAVSDKVSHVQEVAKNAIGLAGKDT